MVEFQSTPNPNSMKVLPGHKLVDGSLIVGSEEDAGDNEVAKQLLAIDGVKDLFFLNDFVTVSKEEGADWTPILEQVEAVFKA